MFDERYFVTQKQQQWQDLSVIVERVKLQGLRNMPQQDLARLGSLYRRTATDLALSRAQSATSELIFYLNELVGQGHGVLYQETSDRSVLSVLRDFFAWDLPLTLRKRGAFVLTAFLLTVAGIVFAYFVVHADQGNINLFLPAEFRDSFDAWKHGFSDKGTISAGEGADFSASLMTHNTSVGLAAFALGITIVLPIYLMLQNGFVLGALIAAVQPTPYLTSMWAGILPHGVCELSAIFIDGGAGFLIGWSLIHPGQLSRRDALLVNAKDAVKMMLGSIALFIIAGIIEGNVSHSAIPHWAKFTLAAVQLAALLFYIYGGWVRSPTLELGATA